MNVLVYRFGVRAGHNVEASVVERRPRNREPESDLRTSAEREIMRVLMPRLSHRAPIFEDELADETIDLGSQQFLRNLDVVTILDQRETSHRDGAGKSSRLRLQDFARSDWVSSPAQSARSGPESRSRRGARSRLRDRAARGIVPVIQRWGQ